MRGGAPIVGGSTSTGSRANASMRWGRTPRALRRHSVRPFVQTWTCRFDTRMAGHRMRGSDLMVAHLPVWTAADLLGYLEGVDLIHRQTMTLRAIIQKKGSAHL